jgi:hypothetical protein
MDWKNTTDFKMFSDFWQLYKEAHETYKNTDTWWDLFCKKIDNFYQKYKQFPISRYIMNGLQAEMESKNKG